MKIINVFKTHFDIGYTDLSSNVIRRYGGEMLKAVLDTCEKTSSRPVGKRFVWTMAAWPMIKSLELCSEKDRARAEKLIENGQLTIHALPFTLHTESLGEADMPHLFDAADAFCAKYRKPFPVAAKMTDVPGHTIALVSALAKRGVKFLHVGCNPASTPPDVPTLFWWEDRAGNRVLTFYNRTYGSDILPPKGWKFPVWLSMQQSNDNMGPQDAEILEEIEGKVRQALPRAEVVFGTMDDFYREISKCDLSGLPVVKEDLGDTWIHGIASYPKEVGMLRRARSIVAAAPLTEEEKREFYENSLLFSEHTWGMDVKTFLTWRRSYEKEAFRRERELLRYRLVEQSWDEQRARAQKCAEIASRYAPLYPSFPDCVSEDETYRIGEEGGKPLILNKKTGRKIRVDYCYEIVGTQKMTDFMRRYLTRFYGWALSDFGRDSYGEVENRKFGVKTERISRNEGATEFVFGVPEESRRKFGNAEKIKMTLGIADGKVRLRAELFSKEATPYIEGGNLVLSTDCPGNAYRVKKLHYPLNPAADIRKDANQRLYCVSDLVAVDDVKVCPVDSPLVSFGGSAIYRFNGGKYRRPRRADIVFNLFNNMWGTNFPQWIEGDFTFDYTIE